MNAQASLFDAPAHGGYRRNGPRSSVDAAASMSGPVLRRQQFEVLAMVAGSEDGATSYEIARRVAFRIQQNVAGKRLEELRGEDKDAPLPELVRRVFDDAGQPVQRPGSSSRMCDVHEVTHKGREWLSGEVEVRVAGGRL